MSDGKPLLAGAARLPVLKRYDEGLAPMGAKVLRGALEDAGLDPDGADLDALFVSNMLADALQNERHMGPLVATAAGLRGIEAWHVTSAMASGAAALRAAYMAVMSGEARIAAAVGLEKMQDLHVTDEMAKALDFSERELDITMVKINAQLMRSYMETHRLSHDVFLEFSWNAHHNASLNADAYLGKEIDRESLKKARLVEDPLTLYDCAPVCEGAAAVILARPEALPASDRPRVRMRASSCATELLPVLRRPNPLALDAARLSAEKAYRAGGLGPADIDAFEVHDAFSIMAVLSLEACGFAETGQGWRFGETGAIRLDGSLPAQTFGGLKARGHPIGATALYQASEILQQLQRRAGPNQIQKDKLTNYMMNSIGGAGTSLFTHIFSVAE